VSPSEAISTLYKSRGLHYDAYLVEQFIRFIGIFPVGSLVELQLGRGRRGHLAEPGRAAEAARDGDPDVNGSPLPVQKLLDLSRSPKASLTEPYRIVRTLEQGAVPVTSEELLHEVTLLQLFW